MTFVLSVFLLIYITEFIISFFIRGQNVVDHFTDCLFVFSLGLRRFFIGEMMSKKEKAAVVATLMMCLRFVVAYEALSIMPSRQ